MANAQTIVTITHDKGEVATDLISKGITAQAGKLQHANFLMYLLNRFLGGVMNASLTTVINNGDAVAASLTATLTGVQAGDQILVNGIAFTAVASGATAYQFNIGGSDAITASNLASQVNASTDIRVQGLISASAASNVVTFTALVLGLVGNDLDLEGRGSGAIAVTGAGAQASGTLTFTTAGVAGDTFQLNGVVFTAVASGATGNQYNVGGTAALTAANAAAAINASTASLVQGEIYASVSGAVVTVKATRSGIYGNLETILAGQASITASGARMTGGTDSAVVNFAGGAAATGQSSVTYKQGM